MFRARKLLLLLSSWYASTTVWMFLNFSFHEDNDRQEVHRLLRKESNYKYSFQNTTYHKYGTVLQEFAKRVLSRHITSSNVLIVSPDAERIATEMRRNTTSSQVNKTSLSVGARFLIESAKEGHSVHAVGNNDHNDRLLTTLDDWWASFDVASKPSWILLAVFDDPTWMEDEIWKRASTFLLESTTTYIALGMHSVRHANGTYRFGGLTAVEKLLERRYKLQTLSVSHYSADHEREREIFEKYGPNALFQTTDEVREFLKWGADAASRSSDYGGSGHFSSFLFATQGLDLAIPDPQFYLNHHRNASWGGKGADIASVLKDCPQSLGEIRLNLSFDEGSLRVEESHSGKTVKSWSLDTPNVYNEDFEVWTDGNSVESSEAACVKSRNSGFSKCVTRILESKRNGSAMPSNSNNYKANVLVVLLDPISRSHFRRVMPQTRKILEELNFTHFPKYTAVGPNSGPNQAALYSGMALQKRNGIERNASNKWLWDRLRDAGYITLKAEDNCIENSNMIQSLSPNTTHGMNLQGLFCFDSFARPNCMGPEPASSILLNYGDQFITTYDHHRMTQDSSLRWASFLHFTDSHEDTMLLAASVDQQLAMFLKKIQSRGVLAGTAVIVSSDHGLHYGPVVATPAGRREAAQPVLYMRLPQHLQSNNVMEHFENNAQTCTTTPFDVHETLLHLTRTLGREDQKNQRKGQLLTQKNPDDLCDCQSRTFIIPEEYCVLQEETEEVLTVKEVSDMNPKMESFFQDIPTATMSI